VCPPQCLDKQPNTNQLSPLLSHPTSTPMPMSQATARSNPPPPPPHAPSPAFPRLVKPNTKQTTPDFPAAQADTLEAAKAESDAAAAALREQLGAAAAELAAAQEEAGKKASRLAHLEGEFEALQVRPGGGVPGCVSPSEGLNGCPKSPGGGVT